ncbi:MAG: hypothetical protein AAGF12_21275 [Myxococcota bacterium]
MNQKTRYFLAVLEIWDELPRLAGRGYAALHPRLLAALAAIDAAEGRLRDLRVLDLLDLLQPIPGVWDRIRASHAGPISYQIEALARSETTSSFDDAIYGDPLRERLQPPRIRCRTDVAAPRRMWVGSREVVTVGLVERGVADRIATHGLELLFDREIEVHLFALSPGIEVLEGGVQQLAVPTPRVSTPRTAFFLRGREAGVQDLCLEFSQAGESVLTIPFSVEVVPERSRLEVQKLVSEELVSRGLEVPPADLEFRVTTSTRDGSTRFHFTLHSPTAALEAFNFSARAEEIAVVSPEEYRRRLFDGAGLSTDDTSPVTEATAKRRLLSLGETLFDKLLPSDIQDLFDKIDPQQVETVHIASDEPWIPWELLRLRSDSGDDHGFLCERFAVTRWLKGKRSPPGSLRVGQAVWCEPRPRTSEADGVSADGPVSEVLSTVAAAEGVHLRLAHPETLDDLDRILAATPPQLWHFEGPGELSSGQDRGLKLGSGTLWPLDFDDERCSHLAQGRPLVVFNVGAAGELSWGASQLEGWAPTWVLDCRCSGFIAPICRGDKALGRYFCAAVYQHLAEVPLGEAVRRARQATRAQGEGDPTWAIYSAYGHPNAKIIFGPPEPDPPRR